jgi:hypothetical protein
VQRQINSKTQTNVTNVTISEEVLGMKRSELFDLVVWVVSTIIGVVLVLLAASIGFYLYRAKKLLSSNEKEREEGVVQKWSHKVQP